MQHSNDSYCSRVNFGGGGSCSQYCFNVFARWHQRLWFKIWSIWLIWWACGLKDCKIVLHSLSILFFRHFSCRIYRLATMHFVTDRRMDRQTERRWLRIVLVFTYSGAIRVPWHCCCPSVVAFLRAVECGLRVVHSLEPDTSDPDDRTHSQAAI